MISHLLWPSHTFQNGNISYNDSPKIICFVLCVGCHGNRKQFQYLSKDDHGSLPPIYVGSLIIYSSLWCSAFTNFLFDIVVFIAGFGNLLHTNAPGLYILPWSQMVPNGSQHYRYIIISKGDERHVTKALADAAENNTYLISMIAPERSEQQWNVLS